MHLICKGNRYIFDVLMLNMPKGLIHRIISACTEISDKITQNLFFSFARCLFSPKALAKNVPNPLENKQS